MVALLLLAAAVATGLLVAASLRLESLVSMLLAAYLALVANLALVTVVLSPVRGVTRSGLAVAETLLLAGALAAWWLRGRPRLPVAAALPGARQIVTDPVTALFLAVTLAALGYELVLALTVPPNTWDALTYHLPRAAAWAQEGGYSWIPNAPTDRMNEFPPLAEQELLFLFVATGSGALMALPQFVAELAILTAVYGAARRLGFEPRPAACSAFLLAMFALVALQATTAQNDLVAASFPAVAACFLLGNGRLETVLGGVAVGIGAGAKLTTLLVLPVIAWLALLRGRRAFVAAAAGAVAGFVAVGMWGYVLNQAHTGHPLGDGASRMDFTASPSYPGSVATGVDVLYLLLDLSSVSDRLILGLALGGLVAAALAALYAARRSGAFRAALAGTRVAIPFLAPVLVIGLGTILAWLSRRGGFPVRGVGGTIGEINRSADFAAFGAVGVIALLGVPLLTAVLYVARRVDTRHLALALALPSFLVLLSLGAKFNVWLPRFLLVPAVLTAPLFGFLFRGRAATAAYLVVAPLLLGLAITNVRAKAVDGWYGHPWQLTQEDALLQAGEPQAAASVTDFERLVPAHACVGAVLGPDEPSYLLWGPRLERRITYLPPDDPVVRAELNRLSYVVVTSGSNAWAAGEFRAEGWSIRPLTTWWLVDARLPAYWRLATAPGAKDGSCSTRG